VQFNLFLTLIFVGIALAGTIIVLLYYIFVQKPELAQEKTGNRKLVLQHLKSTAITRIEIERMAKDVNLEEYTLRDVLLELARENTLPGLLVFPNLYYSIHYCLDTIQNMGLKEIPLKSLAKELDTTTHNIHKMLIELITNHGLQGRIDTSRDVFIPQSGIPAGKDLTCPFCNAPITATSETCPSCNAQFTKCGVCNLVIGNEASSICPFCKSPSHTDHLLEWLKIKGTCPVCKHKLKEAMLE
jgi:rubrerythrin